MKSRHNFTFWIPAFAGMTAKVCLFLSFCLQPLAFSLASNEIARLAAGVQCRTFENGLVCITKEDHAAPLVSIQIWVGTGSAQEEEYLGGGLSHFIEHMIFKGTPTRKPADIAKEIDAAGGSINAYTSLDRTVFRVDMPAEKWLTGLDVLADAVTRASFPDDEWRREKDVIRREMAMNNDNPGRALSKLLWQTAFLVHPYRFPVIGREEIFNSLGRADLLKFFRRNYVPDNMIVSVVGDVRAGEVHAALEARFGGIGCRARPLLAQPVEPPQSGPRFARKTGDYNISRLEMAWHTVDLSHPDAPALDVLASIAGGGKSARLARKIKEEQKFCFHIDAWSYTPKDAGLFGISASFDPTNETALIKAIEAEVANWRGDSMDDESKKVGRGVSAEPSDEERLTQRVRPTGEQFEIDKARNQIMSATLLAFQTMHGQADTFASGRFYAGTPLYFQTYLKLLEEVTPQSLAAAAGRYLGDNNRTLVILSPVVTNGSNSMDRNFNVGRDGSPSRPKSEERMPRRGIPTLTDRNFKTGRDGSPSRPKSEERMPRRGIPTLTYRNFNVGRDGSPSRPKSEERMPRRGIPTLNGIAGETNCAPAEINVVKKILPNGLTLLCREDRRLPFVALSIVSLGGLLLENEKNSGVTCLMAELLARGTEKRSQEQIAGTIEQSGGSLSSFSGLNSFGLQARCFSKDTELFLDILADCFMRPVFPAGETAKCKNIQAARIDEQHESPVFLAQEAMRKALFAGHPYSLNVEGTRESVMSISREEIGRLHAVTAVASNTVLAVFGDIAAEKAVEMAEKYFGKMAAGQRQEGRSSTCPTRPTCPTRQINLTSPREQTVVLMGFPGLAVADKRIDALDIVLQALNGLSADLMINVRDRKGLAYYTGAYHRAGLAGGQFIIYAGTRAEEAERVADLIKKEINRLSGGGVRADEFERARQQIISEQRQRALVNSGLALECALDEICGLGFAHALSVEQRLGRLTMEEVRGAAGDIMREDKAVLVTVKPEHSKAGPSPQPRN